MAGDTTETVFTGEKSKITIVLHLTDLLDGSVSETMRQHLRNDTELGKLIEVPPFALVLHRKMLSKPQVIPSLCLTPYPNSD